MHTNPIAYFAKTNARRREQPFGIRPADRRLHLYVVGKTGTGKTTLLRNLVIQDMHAGRGVALIDPHGDLATELLDFVPRARTDGRGGDQVLYFDPADLERPIGFNLLEHVAPDRRHLVASAVVSAFKNLWRDSWGPRLEYILYQAVAALLESPGTTLLDLPRLFTDDRFREHTAARVSEPLVAAFWRHEYPSWDLRFRTQAVAPVQNKVGRLLSAPPLRYVLGQVHGKLRPAEILERGGILLANLSKGRLGEDKAHLLGALLVSAFQTAALGRAEVQEERRRDFFLHIDEFHNFTTDAFATILAEARKYRLNLTLSHQYLEQMSEPVRAAVFGNVGTLISFRVGNHDARVLAREFFPTFSEGDLLGLPKHAIYLKLAIDGVTSPPFSAVSLPPLRDFYVGAGGNVRAQSHRKYGRSRGILEAA